MKTLLQEIMTVPWAMEPKYLSAMIEAAGEADEPLDIDARLGLRKERKIADDHGAIAVIKIHGVVRNRADFIDRMLGLATAETWEEQIRTADADPNVKAIILDVDSPGGAVGGTPEVGAAIRDASKPVIAQVNDLAASAAYWIASQADEIVATAPSQIGSIGVIAIHQEISEMMEQDGVKTTVITSSQYKGEGNPFEPLTEEAQAHIQGMVNKYDEAFVAAVAEGRGVDKSVVRSSYGQGRTMIAADALSAGMIDRVGTLRETLTRLGARIDSDKQQNRAGARRPVALARKRLELETALQGQN